jgi:hypothetical protein
VLVDITDCVEQPDDLVGQADEEPQGLHHAFRIARTTATFSHHQDLFLSPAKPSSRMPGDPAAARISVGRARVDLLLTAPCLLYISFTALKVDDRHTVCHLKFCGSPPQFGRPAALSSSRISGVSCRKPSHLRTFPHRQGPVPQSLSCWPRGPLCAKRPRDGTKTDTADH